MVSATEIVRLQDRLTREWHGPRMRNAMGRSPPRPDSKLGGKLSGAGGSPSVSDGEWLGLVARQHRANFDLWHIEDEARTPGASDAEIAGEAAHRPTNQLRNDLPRSWTELAGAGWKRAVCRIPLRRSIPSRRD
jgi:hypothetical protein